VDRHGPVGLAGMHDPRPVVGRGVLGTSSPDGIRTRATALRGRRARPLHNGALADADESLTGFSAAEEAPGKGSCLRISPHAHVRAINAGVQGLEPRLTEPESVVLPITPYPIGVSLSARPSRRSDGDPRMNLTGPNTRSPNRSDTNRPADTSRCDPRSADLHADCSEGGAQRPQTGERGLSPEDLH
jgi:hypothetical protein